MKKYWRIAIASLDAIVVNEHFGRAKEFLIVDIYTDGTNQYIGKRAVTPLCNSCEHSDEDLLSILDVLSDCTAVLVSRIGITAKIALQYRNLSVFEYQDYIDTAISKITDYFIRTNFKTMEEK